MSEIAQFDVVIIGAGPAGLTAAIYSAWLGLHTVVLESSITGGRAWIAPRIENFPGFPEGIKGSDLVDLMSQQATRFKAEVKTDEEVIGLQLNGAVKRVTSRKETYEATVIIIATGTQKRKLRVAGETEFLGRGVSYCAVCDGPFFRNSPVAIVGNTEETAIDALALADLASKVTIVSQEQGLTIEGTLLNRLKEKANVEIIRGKVTHIRGEQVVKAVSIQRFGVPDEVELEVKGVFISLGGIPLTAIVKNANIITDRNGCLTVDRQQRTNVEGVFAAGDCTCGGMQAITAAGEGAMAAMRASTYIRTTCK